MKTELPDSSAYQRLFIKPIINYAILEEVFIITKEPDKEFLELIEGEE
jgi:hypothetical protein